MNTKMITELLKQANNVLVDIDEIKRVATTAINDKITHEDVWCAILQAIDVTEEDLQPTEDGQYFEGTLTADNVVQLSYIVDKVDTSGVDWEVKCRGEYIGDVLLILADKFGVEKINS